MASQVKDKFPILAELVKDKDVLDIGCVQHKWENSFEDDWIHKYLCKYAKSVIGIDNQFYDVEVLRHMGYNILYGDAEDLHLGLWFDTIFAGELIEHLDNHGKFLESCKSHLRENGQLIITTVNCFSLLFFILYIFRKLKVNNEHTCWYDEITLEQLLERYGFKVQKVYYFHRYETSNNPLKLLLSNIFKRLCPVRMRDNLMVVASI